MGCKGSSEKKEEVQLLVKAGTYKITTFETEGKVLIRENNGAEAGAVLVIAEDANDGEGAGHQYWEVTVDDQQIYTIKAATAEGELFLTAGAVGESASIQPAGDRQKFKIGESKAGWLTLSLAEGGNALERESDGMDAGTKIAVAEALGDIGMTGEQRFKFIAVNQAVAAEEEKEAEAEAEAEKVEEEAKEEAEKAEEEAKEEAEKVEEEAKEAEEKAEEEAKEEAEKVEEEAKEAEEKAEEEAKEEAEKVEEEAKAEENAVEGALGL